MGKDPRKVAPVLYCVDDARATYSGNVNLNAKAWFYDDSNLEFKNGQVCSYDKQALAMYTSAYIYTYATPTGLTDDQLSVTNGNVMNTPYTQSSVLDTQKAQIWENFNNQVQNNSKKDVLLGSGVLPEHVDTQRWQYANQNVSPVRSTLRQLRDLSLDSLTNQDLLDFKLDLDWFFDNQLDVATAVSIAKDVKREWTLSPEGYLAVAEAANTITSPTNKCGTLGDKTCSASGFYYTPYTEILGDVFRTQGCASVPALPGNEPQCESALLTVLASLTTGAEVVAKQREWLRNVVTFKYLNGAGDTGLYKLRTTMKNAANTRTVIA